MDTFKREMSLYFSSCDKIYILEAITDKGRMPVAYVTGKFMGAVLFIETVVWFPWASIRNKYESAVHFFNKVRDGWVGVFYAPYEDKDFFNKIAQHGVLRRMGTLYDAFDDKVTLFQTRKR